MNQQIRRTTFIESFDTVRDIETLPDLEFRQRQSRLELILSLLFGQQLAVPEHVSFDSYWFLQNAYQILEARKRFEKLNIKDLRKIRECCPVWNPFILALRDLNIYKDNGGGYLGLITTRFADEKFIWSSLPNLTNDSKARTEIANVLRKKEWRNAQSLANNENTMQHLKYLEELQNYFEPLIQRNERIYPTNQTSLLERRITDARNKSQSHIIPFNNFTEAFKKIDELNTSYKNRSEVRKNGEFLVKKGEISQEVFEGILEIFDDSYNRAISVSIGADESKFSLLGNNANQLVRWADQLTREIAMEYDGKEGEMQLEFKSIKGEDIETKSWDWLDNLNWDNIWETVTDHNWVESVTRLNKALKVRTRTKIEADSEFIEVTQAKEFLESHIELLAKNNKLFQIEIYRGKFQSALETGETTGNLITVLSDIPGLGLVIKLFKPAKLLAQSFSNWRTQGSIKNKLKGHIQVIDEKKGGAHEQSN